MLMQVQRCQSALIPARTVLDCILGLQQNQTKRKEEREGMEEEWAGRMDGDPGEHAAGQERQ